MPSYWLGKVGNLRQNHSISDKLVSQADWVAVNNEPVKKYSYNDVIEITEKMKSKRNSYTLYTQSLKTGTSNYTAIILANEQSRIQERS